MPELKESVEILGLTERLDVQGNKDWTVYQGKMEYLESQV